MCATSAQRGHTPNPIFRHERLQRHRQNAAAGAPAPRYERARVGRRRPLHRSAAAHSTLTLPTRKVGDPDLPRNANALGLDTRGRFVFGVREGSLPCCFSLDFSGFQPAPKHPRACAPQGRCRRGAARRCVRMLRHGRCGGRPQRIGRLRPHELASGDRRQCEASDEGSAAARVRIPSGARGPAVAYAAESQTVFLKRRR